MRKLHVLLLPLSFMFLACGEDEGSLTITFQATYDDQPLQMFETFDYAFGQRIQFTRADFFVSDLRLYSQSGNAYLLSDLELIDLSFADQAGAENGVSLTFAGVPAGTYQSVEFGIGVSPVLNSTVPADYPSAHPLSETGRYWHAWNSYIFSKTEGNLDTLDNGVDEPDLGFAYHTGADDMYVDVGAATPVNIADGINTTLTLRMDYHKLLGVGSDPINIKKKPQNHNPADTVELKTIRTNYSTALTFIAN